MTNIIETIGKAKNIFFKSKPKNLIFGIHGGGNIGLGCMADIVSRSHLPYQIIATSSDQFANGLINCSNQFWLRHGPEKNNLSTCVNNVSMINTRNQQEIYNLYNKAHLMAICLPDKAFLNVTKMIARGLLNRYENNHEKLKILILMNKLRCNHFVENEVCKTLSLITGNPHFTKEILQKVQFIPTVVDRMVSKIDKRIVLKQLKKQIHTLSVAELFKIQEILDLEKPFHQQVELILQNYEKLLYAVKTLNLKFYLFNAEKEFSLCVPQYFEEADHFLEIKTVHDLHQWAEIKNKFINGPHSMLAWMGGLMGCSTIGEAINNPSMLWFITRVMENEIAPILKAEYPNITTGEFKFLKNSFIERCKANPDDPIERVGRDPLRKLISKGRVRGIIEIKQKHKLKIATPELERGIAAGILYAVKKIDPNNEECQKIHEIYRKSGSYQDILCYKGPYDNGTYPGLDSKQDLSLIKNVLDRISTFEKVYKIRKSYRKCT